MKKIKLNWYLKIGLLIYSLTSFINHIIKMPHFLYGLGIGLALALELIGAYSINHDIKNLKKIKRRLIKSLSN